MGLFSNNFNKPGPGIPKDAPQKKGSALFFEILGREFWSLLSLNLIYLLACIPIITIGPATVALNRVTVTMVRDQNVYVWRDFWEAFRKNIKQGMLFGIPATLFVISAVVIDLGMLITPIGSDIASLLWTALILLWNLLGVSAGCYIFPLVAYVYLPTFPLLKNALLLVVLGKWRTLVAAGACIAATAAAVLYYPISIIVVMFIGFFAFVSFFVSFMVWPVIDQYVIHGVAQEESTELQEQGPEID